MKPRLARSVNRRLAMTTLSRETAGVGDGAPESSRLRRLVDRALPGAQILRVVPLGADSGVKDETTKGAGYGAPLRLDVEHEGKASSLVLHTANANDFGHDRRADRASAVLLSADTFSLIPRHVAVLDVGAFRGTHDFVSLADTGEFYLLTTHAQGTPYASDLRQIAERGTLTALDLARHDALVGYLSVMHAERPVASAAAYARSIRDTLGSGEGVFGIVDGYPADTPQALRARLERIEEQCLRFRHALRGDRERLRRIHGDFHPFNVLFDQGSEPWLLDTSRGSLGDPADDVACMAINYAFFALGRPGVWRGALRALWSGFWEKYQARQQDSGLFRAAPLFLAWRGLVLSSPVWYPELQASDRDRILSFIERALSAPEFPPNLADEFFDA